MKLAAVALVFGFQVIVKPACAVGPTGQQDSLSTLQEQRAPLAFSSDGRWRFHVGANKQLHRSTPGADKPSRLIALPVFAHTLASSGSGERVVFTSNSQCIGLVDFKRPAGQPVLTWLASGAPFESDHESSGPKAAGMPREASCGPGAREIAISTDGRLLATPAHVIDIDRQTVIATLPRSDDDIYGRAVIKLAFVDNDTRLLVISATLGEGYESLDKPSNYQIAVWDLASKSLIQLQTIPVDGSFPSLIYFAQVAPASGAVYRVDNAANYARQMNWKDGMAHAPLELVRHRLDRCDHRPEYLAKLAPDQWKNALVDPLGRWIAVVDKPGAHNKPVDETVSVRDIRSGNEFARFHAPAGIRGLLAAHDGASITGLTVVPDKRDGQDRENYGGEPVRFDIPRDKLAATRAPAPTPTAVCAIEDETPQARKVLRTSRLLTPAWSIPLAEFESAFPGNDDALWLDRGATVSRLDPATGRVRGQFPTGRRENMTFVAAPRSGGYITYEGDTLAWRSFKPGAGRRVIEKRPGWTVAQVNLQGRSVVAFWQAPENARVPVRWETRQDIEAVAYHARTLKPVLKRHMAGDTLGMIGDVTDAVYGGAAFALCTDSLGPLRSGHDWRLSHFDSFRFLSCGPRSSQTRMWSHIDIAPRVDKGVEYVRAALAHDGSIAVAQDGGQLRVFDAAAREEIAQIALKGGHKPNAVFVLARLGLILVETPAEQSVQFRNEVTAYALPRLAKMGNKK